jgi:hypothetical protein
MHSIPIFLVHLFVSAIWLSTPAGAQTPAPGGFVDGGSTQVSAMMVRFRHSFPLRKTGELTLWLIDVCGQRREGVYTRQGGEQSGTESQRQPPRLGCTMVRRCLSFSQ